MAADARRCTDTLDARARCAVPNRVLLAPLAGIGNWFVRLQAKRYGAGMAVSEMVSSHAIHYRNAQDLRGDAAHRPARARAAGRCRSSCSARTPTMMRSAAAHVAAAGADAIDINMGCPVPKVAQDRRRRGAARATPSAPSRSPRAGEGAEGAAGLPVTVKLRSGMRAGRRRAASSSRTGWSPRPGVAAIAFHPRSAAVQHKGAPDYELAARAGRARCRRP